jgi:hypothetical protein
MRESLTSRWAAGLLAGTILVACAATDSPSGVQAESGEHVFYRKRDVGSESAYNPISVSLQYVLDSAQVENFGTGNYWDDLGTVVDHLLDPVDAIEDEGGFGEFVHNEIFPIYPDKLSDSAPILPNLALHAFGGGLVYRKNAEWFDAHGYPAPYLVSGTLAMATELLGEATEKPTSVDTDEVADFYIYRPLGLWLFTDDDRARWIQRTLDPVVWPNLLMWDFEEEEFVNQGLSYAVRPTWFGSESARPFAYLGITNLIGMSHTLASSDALSWGLGAATETINPDRFRFSGGLFYDRAGSLLASLLVNGAEGYALRANVQPGVLLGRESPMGLFLAVADDGEPMVGVHYRLPVGLAR